MGNPGQHCDATSPSACLYSTPHETIVQPRACKSRCRFLSQVRNEFYKDTQGCILVYDVTNRACFEALDGWLKEAQDNGAENMVRATLLPSKLERFQTFAIK